MNPFNPVLGVEADKVAWLDIKALYEAGTQIIRDLLALLVSLEGELVLELVALSKPATNVVIVSKGFVRMEDDILHRLELGRVLVCTAGVARATANSKWTGLLAVRKNRNSGCLWCASPRDMTSN